MKSTGRSKRTSQAASVANTDFGSMPQILAVTNDGTRLIFPLLNTGEIVMPDISNPDYPFVLDVFNLGPGSQQHVAVLTDENNPLVVTVYFLHEEAFAEEHCHLDHTDQVL